MCRCGRTTAVQHRLQRRRVGADEGLEARIHRPREQGVTVEHCPDHRVIAGIVAAASLADDEARRPQDVLRREGIADRLSAGGGERKRAEGSGGQGRRRLARAGGHRPRSLQLRPHDRVAYGDPFAAEIGVTRFIAHQSAPAPLGMAMKEHQVGEQIGIALAPQGGQANRGALQSRTERQAHRRGRLIGRGAKLRQCGHRHDCAPPFSS